MHCLHFLLCLCNTKTAPASTFSYDYLIGTQPVAWPHPRWRLEAGAFSLSQAEAGPLLSSLHEAGEEGRKADCLLPAWPHHWARRGGISSTRCGRAVEKQPAPKEMTWVHCTMRESQAMSPCFTELVSAQRSAGLSAELGILRTNLGCLNPCRVQRAWGHRWVPTSTAWHWVALVLPLLACEHTLSAPNHPNTTMGSWPLAVKVISSFQRRCIWFLNACLLFCDYFKKESQLWRHRGTFLHGSSSSLRFQRVSPVRLSKHFSTAVTAHSLNPCAVSQPTRRKTKLLFSTSRRPE